MDFLAAYEEKLSVNAATNYLQEEKIVAKINESLQYKKSYGKMEIDDYVGTSIYRNGHLNQSLLSTNRPFYGTNELCLLVNIPTYQDEAGEYSVIGYADSRSLRRVSGCPPYLDDFVRFDFRIFDIIWHAASLQILTAGK